MLERPLVTPARIESFARRALDGTPYVLTGIVGEGGMGYVFEAEHAELKRRAAIKVLGVSMAHNARAMDRLRREARVLARLANPHIVDVYDMGFTADGQPYIAMSFIDGQDLAKNLEADGPFGPARVVRIAEQVAEALCDVHAQGMVHRDLKPENIMIEPRDGSEHVVLLDFGIAWVLDADTQITRDGQVMGTPGYIAPEQALGQPVDGRADQYGLAAVLYQLLTGNMAYSGTSGLELMTAQLTSEPRPFDADDARVPAAMQQVVMRALSRLPDDRFPDLHAFAAALRASLVADETPMIELDAPAPPRFEIIASIAVLALGAALFAWSPWSRSPIAPDAPIAGHAEVTPTPLLPPGGTAMTQPARPATPLSVAAAPTSAAPATIAVAPPKSLATDAEPAIVEAPPRPAVSRRPAPKLRRAAKPKRAKRPTRKAHITQRPAPKPPADEPKAAPRSIAPTSIAPASTAPAPARLAAAPTVASTRQADVARSAPAPARPALVIGTPVIRGAVSDRPIHQALHASHAALRACVGRIAAPVVGRATIRLSIDADGFLSSVRGEGAPALAECGVTAVKRVRRLRRRPDTGNIQVQLPLRMAAK